MKINTILLSAGLDAEALELEFDSSKLLDYIRYALPKSIVHFQYLKDDGSARLAFGTTKPELIPSKKAINAEALFSWCHTIANDNYGPEVLKAVTELVEEIEVGHKPAKDHGAGTIIYYDLEKQAFRSFLPEKLLAIY